MRFRAIPLIAVMLVTCRVDSAVMPKLPEGWVAVEEEVWLLYVDEPATYFQEAHGESLNGNHRAAAERIRKGRGFVTVAARRAKAETKASLRASADDLRDLAKRVGTPSVTRQDLEEAFGRAEYALAKHHRDRAFHYSAKKDSVKMGQSVEAAVTHALHAAAWSGGDLPQEDVVAAKEARSIARGITDGAVQVPKKVTEGLTAIGRCLRRIGQSLKPGKAAEGARPPQ